MRRKKGYRQHCNVEGLGGEWLRREEEVELKLWFMDSPAAWVPTLRERGTTRGVDFIESESVSLT